MYAHELSVDKIAKRDIVFAIAKSNMKIGHLIIRKDDRVMAYGHWDTPDGIYCNICDVNDELIHSKEPLDVILNFIDWDFKIQALVEFKKTPA
jgi:hypothetical protein